METDGQRLYSILTRKEVGEKMMKEIEQISEVFSLSKSDATVILIRLRWNSFQASDRLVEDKEKFLAELGLVKVFSSCQENESFSSFADNETHGVGHCLLSTPFCSHKFCSACWRDHLNELPGEKKKNEEERVAVVLCPYPGCVASVGPDTVEKLSEPVKEMYESYVLGSFMEGKKESIKWCPAPGCDYAIERHEDLLEDDQPSLDFGVVCLCGHTFCWSCQLESHRPVTCYNASVWCNRTLNEFKSVVWVVENTKLCPRCNSAIEGNNDPDLRLVICSCSLCFCWRCLRSEEKHKGKWNCPEVSSRPPSKNKRKANDDSSYVETQTHYLNLWKTSHEALEKSKSDLKEFDENHIQPLIDNFGSGKEDMWAVQDARLLIFQCRLVLKWTCVFEYFITGGYQSAKKQYMTHLRDEATKTLVRHIATLEELMSGALSSGDFSYFKLKLSASTTTTGNYFHGFVKALEGENLSGSEE